MEEAGSSKYGGFSLVGLLQSMIGWAGLGQREVFFFLLDSKVGKTFLFGVIGDAWQIMKAPTTGLF